MRTTVNLSEDVLRLLKAKAAETGRSLGALIDDAVRTCSTHRSQARSGGRVELPVFDPPVFDGHGVLPGVDLADSAALLDVMEDRARP